MDSDSIAKIIAMIILTAMSAFFSSAETAFTAFNKSKIKTIAQPGNKNAELVLKISEDCDKLLMTLLIAKTIVNISLASLGTLFFLKYFSSAGGAVSAAAVTLVVLVFGEVLPKGAAKENSDSAVLRYAVPVRFVSLLLSPLAFLFLRMKSGFKRKKDISGDPFSMTEEALITFVEEAEQDGEINQEESDLIRSAIEFIDVSAEDILTPRVDVAAIGLDLDMEEIAKVFIESGYSRLPVYDEDIDDVIGILHEKDFFMAYYKGIDDIREVLQKPLFISGHVKISNLLQILKNSKCHLAVVVDEFGGMTGIVTMEDIIEELIGDVWDEHDEIIEQFTELEDGSCLVDCSASIDDLFEKYDISISPEDEDDLPQTVNGWLLMEFGNFPDSGDKFEYHGYMFEVTRTSQKKIEEVRVSKINPVSLREENE